MTFIKKYTLLFLCVYLLRTDGLQAIQVKNDTVAWEQYISLQSMTALTAGALLYNCIMIPRDLTFQGVSEKTAQDALKNSQYITVYSPGQASDDDNEIQKIANTIEHTIITLDRYYLSQGSLILLFDQAIKLSPCVIYIISTIGPNGLMRSDSTGPIRSNNQDNKAFLKEMNYLQKTNNDSVVVFGHAKNNKLQSVHDIFAISFNIKNDCPSYQERVEFLSLLLSTDDALNLDAQDLARKTIAFSYQEMINFVQKIKNLAGTTTQSDDLNRHVAQARAEITRSQSVNADEQMHLYRTSVHEMGHAIVTAIYSWDFILHNVTATPQLQGCNNSLGSTQTTRNAVRYEHEDELILLYERNIMMLLAGKVAEQIVFGLPDGQELTAETGYADLVGHPGGARDDLNKANNIAQDIMRILRCSFKRFFYANNQDALMQDIYAKTLKLILSYKSKIEEGARLLEHQEFLPGSYVYQLVHGYNPYF